MQLEFHQLERRWEHLRVRQPVTRMRTPCVLPRHCIVFPLSFFSILASISAISESSVGCPASVPHVPPSASSRTRFGYLRRISSGDWNSTGPPKASPASCPSKHPLSARQGGR